ncbi:MAG: transglycosylase SLT domain-containing protein [Candidatus Accumulibacter sp.]|jgi:membrane-bound lytic murein transglycosylase D|nr:transglycosylase SLT domain-containing protein [Accumulibacter sp.]
MLSLTRTIYVFALFLVGCAGIAPPIGQFHSRQDDISSADTPWYQFRVIEPAPTLARVELPEQTSPRTIDLTSAPDDLFERIRRGFAMPDLDDDLVRHHQEWYLERPDYLRRVVERSRLYLYHIVEELDKQDMPMELALLPMVESAYNPMAYSRAKASGLWQFMPSTGKHYNLDQDWWKDERRDVVASTAAALEYLQMIYELHGDWHLALASYNWGEGAVGRAIAKNEAQGLPTNYLSLGMPGETRNYVPKLQALKNIFRNPVLMAGLELPEVPNQPYFTTFTTDSRIDVDLAARLAEMPKEEFLALNPAHKRPVIQSDTSLVIPAEKLETFVSNLTAHGDENKPLSVWQIYTLRRGDRLEKIASRFGMSLARLKAVNGIRGKTPRITPGMTLLISGNDKGNARVAAASPAKTAKAPRNSAPKTKARQTPGKGKTLVATTAGKRPSAATPRKPTAGQKRDAPKITRYTVRRGDTIYSIARQFNVAERDLMRKNRVSPKNLKAGATLTIPLLAENS